MISRSCNDSEMVSFAKNVSVLSRFAFLENSPYSCWLSLAWVAKQMVEAFADRETPRYLIRDRDGVYGNEVPRRLKSLRIEEVLTAPQSPWQNAYAERLIGCIRRECLNHFIILNARHLKRALLASFHCYHRSRPHLALSKQCRLSAKS